MVEEEKKEGVEEEEEGSPFRKGVVDKLSSPEQLDQLMVVVRPKAWITLLGLLLLVIAAIIWAIWGEVPVEVSGRGIILTERGLFGISSSESGIVAEIPVKLGDWLKKDTVVLRVYRGEEEKDKPIEIYAYQAGRLAELNVAVGDYLQVGQLIGFGEYGLEEGENLVCRAYFPASIGEKISVGMEGKIALENIDTEVYGFLLGKVSFVSEFPASDRDLIQVLRNPQLVNFMKQDKPTVISVHLIPIKNPNTPSGYAWTSGIGPKEYVKSGSLCAVKIITQKKRPISYLFPNLFEPLTPPLGENPNITPSLQS